MASNVDMEHIGKCGEQVVKYLHIIVGTSKLTCSIETLNSVVNSCYF